MSYVMNFTYKGQVKLMWFKLGMSDWIIALVLWANFFAVVGSVIYGALYWNRDNDQRQEEGKR